MSKIKFVSDNIISISSLAEIIVINNCITRVSALYPPSRIFFLVVVWIHNHRKPAWLIIFIHFFDAVGDLSRTNILTWIRLFSFWGLEYCFVFFFLINGTSSSLVLFWEKKDITSARMGSIKQRRTPYYPFICSFFSWRSSLPFYIGRVIFLWFISLWMQSFSVIFRYFIRNSFLKQIKSFATLFSKYEVRILTRAAG